MQINTSKLGFGLSGIAGSGNFLHQERLVKTAIDCGVTHFDVAPYYGSGEAEEILGKILENCKDPVTIATKFGLVPINISNRRLLLAALRPVFRKFASLKHLASKIVQNSHKPKIENFIKGSLQASVDSSIRKLKRPIDILLLHDASKEFARNPDLIDELNQVCKVGKFNVTGISGSIEDLLNIVFWDPITYKIAQFENSLSSIIPLTQFANSGAKLITHRAIQGGFDNLKFLIEKRPGFKKVWLREFGFDLLNKDIIVQVLIELALSENSKGTVLFSTRSPERIKKITNSLNSPLLTNEGCILVRKIFNELDNTKCKSI